MGVIAAQALAAGGTFTLAFFAFNAIRQTRETQKKLRTEGQLRDVAEWAVDVISAPNIAELPTPSSDLAQLEEPDRQAVLRLFALSSYGNVARELELVTSRGLRIRSIAESLDKDLHSKVADTIDRIVSLKDDITKGGYSEIKEELWQPLVESATRVIERASALMASL